MHPATFLNCPTHKTKDFPTKPRKFKTKELAFLTALAQKMEMLSVTEFSAVRPNHAAGSLSSKSRDFFFCYLLPVCPIKTNFGFWKTVLAGMWLMSDKVGLSDK